MGVLSFIREYWVIITAFVGEIVALIIFVRSLIEASKCSLRNDILDIYDRCKETGKITHYQLQSIKTSYDVYKKFKGNSFVDEIIERVKDFELVD